MPNLAQHVEELDSHARPHSGSRGCLLRSISSHVDGSAPPPVSPHDPLEYGCCTGAGNKDPAEKTLLPSSTYRSDSL
ncbi:unnamed protein product [Urochloa humidicola]